MKNDFLIAITQLSSEKNLPKEVVLQAVETALASAYKKDHDFFGQDLNVKINPSTGDIKVYILRTVVEKVSDKKKEISLEEAKRYKKDARLEDVLVMEAPSQQAGRIAAQTAKQVVLQRLREAEHDAIYSEYTHREGDIVSGTVHRMEGKNVVINLGKAEAILPASEQVKAERYRPGQRMRLYLSEVMRSGQGTQLIVSRTHRNLLKRLMELEVPEIASGVVEIKSIAREAGSRSKVAVTSRQENIDPLGSCVGPRGIRIQNVVTELGGEKIDVVLWSEDRKAYIASALSPAKVIDVEINQDGASAQVIVPDRQLSLAIGKDGQNARLAAKLTGWKIDIKSASMAEKEQVGVKEILVEALPVPEISVPAVQMPVPELVAAAAALVAGVTTPEKPAEKKAVEPVPAAAAVSPVVTPEPPKVKRREAPKPGKEVVPAKAPVVMDIEEVFAKLEKSLERSRRPKIQEAVQPHLEKVEAKPIKAKKKGSSLEEESEAPGKGKKARPQRLYTEDEEEDGA